MSRLHNRWWIIEYQNDEQFITYHTVIGWDELYVHVAPLTYQVKSAAVPGMDW